MLCDTFSDEVKAHDQFTSRTCSLDIYILKIRRCDSLALFLSDVFGNSQTGALKVPDVDMFATTPQRQHNNKTQ